MERNKQKLKEYLQEKYNYKSKKIVEEDEKIDEKDV